MIRVDYVQSYEEEMEGTCEENGYRRNPITNFMLTAMRTKINQMYSEEMGGKCGTITGHLAQYLT
jgi:hypothetical protein